MRQFYHDQSLEKSWQTLKNLKKEINFVLIGGWAVFLYTKKLKSKDIDIVVEFKSLDFLKKRFDLYKNTRLKKYEVKKEGIDVDIYVPFFSNLGLPAEEVIKYDNKIEGFMTLQIEMLLITKQAAFASRKASLKGQKDRIDIISLVLNEQFDFKVYKSLIKKYTLVSFKKDLIELLERTSKVSELNLNRHFFAKKKKEIFKKIQD